MENNHKIKKIIIRRKDDFITALEKNWRDWMLQPLTKLFKRSGITANYITYTGFVLVFIAIWMYLANHSIKSQLMILALAAITDAIDGPTARNNDDVTIKGTWLDHIRDGFLVLWSSYLIYSYKLLSPEIIIIVWALQILLAWICLKDFVLNYLKNISDEENKVLIENFSLDNLQASVIGRLQFFCWIMSYGFLLLSLLINLPILVSLGQALIVIEIIFAGLNILESYQKTI
jgi:phosphatidylglycerophosphate synthase